MSWELRAPQPILNVRKYRDRQFSDANLAVALFFSAVFGAFYFLAQQLQFVMGYSPLVIGPRLLPLAAAVCVGTIVTGFLTPRQGMKVTSPPGCSAGPLSPLFLSRITQPTTYSGITWALLALGLSIGLAFSPCTETITGTSPEDELGVGGADNDTMIECGRSFGIAILGSALSTYYADQPTDRSDTSVLSDLLADATDSVDGELVAQGPADKRCAAGRAPGAGRLVSTRPDGTSGRG